MVAAEQVDEFSGMEDELNSPETVAGGVLGRGGNHAGREEPHTPCDGSRRAGGRGLQSS